MQTPIPLGLKLLLILAVVSIAVAVIWLYVADVLIVDVYFVRTPTWLTWVLLIFYLLVIGLAIFNWKRSKRKP